MCHSFFCGFPILPFPSLSFSLPRGLSYLLTLPRRQETDLQKARRHLISKSSLSIDYIHVKILKKFKPMPWPIKEFIQHTESVREATCDKINMIQKEFLNAE